MPTLKAAGRMVGAYLGRFMPVFLPGLMFLIFWGAVTSGSPRRQFLFGSPFLLLKVAVHDLRGSEVLRDAAITASEAVVGLVLGVFVGSCVGFVLWTSKRLARIARPYVALAGAIPIFSLAPMLIMWFGTGYSPKVVMAGFPVFLAALVQVYQGAKRMEAIHGSWAWGLGMPRNMILLEVVLPECLVLIAEGVQLNAGFALIGAFIGEFVVAEAGLGHYVLRAGALYDTPRVLLGLCLFAIIGLVLAGLGRTLERLVPGANRLGIS